MRRRVFFAIRIVVGWFFILFGLVGLFLPLLQGILFIVIGLYILSLDSMWFRTKLERWVAKDVRIAQLYKRFDTGVRRFFKIETKNDRT